MGWLIERPMLAMRDRLFPSRTRTAVASDWHSDSPAAEGPEPSPAEPHRLGVLALDPAGLAEPAPSMPGPR